MESIRRNRNHRPNKIVLSLKSSATRICATVRVLPSIGHLRHCQIHCSINKLSTRSSNSCAYTKALISTTHSGSSYATISLTPYLQLTDDLFQGAISPRTIWLHPREAARPCSRDPGHDGLHRTGTSKQELFNAQIRH